MKCAKNKTPTKHLKSEATSPVLKGKSPQAKWHELLPGARISGRDLNEDAKAMANEMTLFINSHFRKGAPYNSHLLALSCPNYVSWTHAAGRTEEGHKLLQTALAEQSLHQIIALVSRLSYNYGAYYGARHPREIYSAEKVNASHMPSSFYDSTPPALILARELQMPRAEVVKRLTGKMPSKWEVPNSDGRASLPDISAPVTLGFPRMKKDSPKMKHALKNWPKKSRAGRPKKDR